MASLVRISSGKLAARVDPGKRYDDPCVTSPDAKYRGTENHLYRVEIHQTGNARSPSTGGKGGAAGSAGNGAVVTFKWARDNGHWVTAWLKTSTDAQASEIEVASTRGFTAGGWVELTDDALELAGEPGALVKIAKVDGNRLWIDSGPGSVPAGTPLAWSSGRPNLKVRAWDQTWRGDVVLTDGAVALQESADADGWIDLEDGLQVRFDSSGEYRSGDYWLIPARVGAEKLDWPSQGDKGTPAMLPPKGIAHHYAPLGFITWSDGKSMFTSCHCDFEPLSSCFGLAKTTGEPGPLKETDVPKVDIATKTKSLKRREKK